MNAAIQNNYDAYSTLSLSPLFYDWDEVLPTDLSKYDRCHISNLCPVRVGVNNVGKTKPLWLSSYPDSGDHLLHKLIDTVFQQQGAAKPFYNRKCRLVVPGTITVTCHQVHPILYMNPNPLQRSNEFASSVIMMLRNPIYAVPAHYNAKGIGLYGVIGQVDEQDWMKVRDDFIEPTVENHNRSFISDWMNVIQEWKSYSPTYNVSMYLTYESLFSFTYGPKIIQQLISVFENENFETNLILYNNNDSKDSISCIECLWYHSMTKERLVQYYNKTKKKFEYYESYLPSYSIKQRDYMIQRFQNFANQYQVTDPMLYDIMQRYIDDIKLHIRLDGE